MKIERKYSRKSVPFEEVKRGDFFEWGNSIYLKINDCDVTNAYDCRANVITSFGAKAKVTPLSAKVVIE